jgi:hypothetical protein
MPFIRALLLVTSVAWSVIAVGGIAGVVKVESFPYEVPPVLVPTTLK